MKGMHIPFSEILRCGCVASLLLPLLSMPALASREVNFRPFATAVHTGVGIIHGQPANPVPHWIALVGDSLSEEGRCTGEFITKRYVLTARHCVVDDDDKPRSPDQLWVAGGSGIVNDLIPKKTEVRRIVLLPGMTADVALLDLGEDYNKSPVGPVPLYHWNGLSSSEDSMVMGFGLTESDTPSAELKMARMRVEAFAGSDAYGAPAMRLTGITGYTAPGDSGGPALRQIFDDEKDSVPYFSKLAGVSSGDSVSDEEPKFSFTYTRLSDRIMDWLSQTTGITILKTPSDELVFDRATTKIAVTWHGNTAPERVVLKIHGSSDELTSCHPDGEHCDLEVSELFKKLTQQTDYDIIAVRNGEPVDSVTVQFIPEDTEVEIQHPPKPEKNNNQPYIYQPGSSEDKYTVLGLAAAGSHLQVLLTPQGVNGNTRPCLDGENKSVDEITTDERGVWVCNIMIRKQDRENEQQYKFEIRKVNSPTGDQSRVVDSIVFRVNGRRDNGSTISNAPNDMVSYTAKGNSFPLSGTGPSDSRTTLMYSEEQTNYSDKSSWQLWTARPRSDSYSQNMELEFRLYRNLDIIKRLGDVFFPYLLPDARVPYSIRFVDAKFRRPLQTMKPDNATVISVGKTRGYMLDEFLDQRGGRDVWHEIKAINVGLQENAPEQLTTLCPLAYRSGSWTCQSAAMLVPGMYGFMDFINRDGDPSDMSNPFLRALVYVVEDPVFIFPEQNNSVPGNISVPANEDLNIKGSILKLTANHVSHLKQPGAPVGTVKIYALPIQGGNATPVDQCDIEFSAVDTEDKAFWACKTLIKLTHSGAYQAEVHFNSRDGDDIGGITRFTLIPSEVDIMTPPLNGGAVTAAAVTASGTTEAAGAKKDDDVNKKIAVAPLVQGDEKKKTTVKVTLTPPSGKEPAPYCTTMVDDKGKWLCKPVAVPETGNYTLNAYEYYEDNDQPVAKDNRPFMVKHDKPEENGGCPKGFTLRNDEKCEGPKKEPGHAKDGHGFGGSIGIGLFHFDHKAFKCLVAMVATDGEDAKACLGTNLLKGGGGMPHGRNCPEGNTYDSRTKTCIGQVDAMEECPSGYFLDKNICSGPAAGGEDFLILSPAAGEEWNCRQDCYVYGQIPEDDTANVTLNDPVSGERLTGTGSYPSERYDPEHPTLWRAGPVPLPLGETLDIRAQRMHNGQMVSGVDALQALQVTTPSRVPYTVEYPEPDREVESETPVVIHGTAPTGTQVQVTTTPTTAPCDVVSEEDHWFCPARTFAPGLHTLTAKWKDMAGGNEEPVIRFFTAGSLPPLSIVTPTESVIVSAPYSISGTGHPGAMVTVTGMPAGSACEEVLVADDGKWSCGPDYPLVNGDWLLRAEQTFGDKLSNTALRIYRMTNQQNGVLIFTSPGRDAVLKRGPYSITGKGVPEANVTVTGMPTGNKACSVMVDMNGDWACPADYPLVDGHYRLQATETKGGTLMIAWREFSMEEPPGPVVDIIKLQDSSGCSWGTTTTYNCTTTLHLIDAAGHSVPGQRVTLKMDGALTLRGDSPDQATSDRLGDIVVASGGSRDHAGRPPSGTLTATAGEVTKLFQVQ